MKAGNEFLEIEISSTFSQAKDVTERIVAAAQQCPYNEEVIFALRLSLEEALMNAIRHGNEQDRRKKVRIRYRLTAEQAEIYVVDEGKGFNPCVVPDPTLEENLGKPSGRGIMLMRAYMNVVEYNDQGNMVRLVKLNKAG